jgi:predicted MFS family arabinose efflux permease
LAVRFYVSWRWNFLLNVPLGAVGVALVLAFVPNNSAGDDDLRGYRAPPSGFVIDLV